MRRRDVLKLGGALAAGVVTANSLWPSAALAACDANGDGPYGPLLAADVNGIMLPAGFSSRIVGRSGQVVAGTSYVWHTFPDGGATFRTPDRGWIYVSNSEFVPGGAGAIRFDRGGNIVGAHRILDGSLINCAGGATPWGTWLSGEEYDGGHIWECDPSGAQPGIKREALGTFKHEAAAVDRIRRVVYLTEDRPDGRFYRFRPTRWGDLSAGELQVASVSGGAVTWLVVPAPNDTVTPPRLQVAASTAFNGGEGIAVSRRHVYFATKGDNRVWNYDIVANRIDVLYDGNADPVHQLTGVDNVGITPMRELVVAEDGGNMELVLVSRRGQTAPLLRITGQDGSEITGPAFSPDGSLLYLSSQRGEGAGLTYEISGPFRRRYPRPC